MDVTEIPWVQQSSVPLLSLILWLPIAVLLGVLLQRGHRAQRVIAVAGASLEFLLTLWLVARFIRGTADMQFVEHWRIPGTWISYHLGVDGLSILFLPLTALLALLLVLYASTQRQGPRRRRTLALICAYEALLIGLFVSLDALQFWLFAAAELSVAALLVASLGTSRARVRAAVYLVQCLGLGVCLLLVALLMLAWQHAAVSDGVWTFDMVAWMAQPIEANRQGIVLTVLLLALAIQLPAFPFHAWLPTIARQGPVVTAVVLLGGMKVAIYSLLRLALPMLPDAVHDSAWIITWIALAGVLYAAVLAFMQLNLRRMLAFAIVSQNSAMLVALFSLTQSGFDGGLLLALNYGLSLAGLLLVVGFMYRRAGTALLPRLAGSFDHAPLIGLAFLAAALGRIAMPGTPGFEAAHLALEGMLEARGWTVTLLAASSNVLAAGYLFWAYQRIFLAHVPRPRKLSADLTASEKLMVGLLFVIMFGVGLYATPWLEIVSASTEALAAQLAEHTAAVEPAAVSMHVPMDPAHGH